MTRRYYSSTAEPATLVSGVNSSAVNITVSTVAGWPVSYPYTIVVDIDTVDEEIMDVTGASGTVLTVTRGVAGSAAVDHLAGANIRHAVDGRDFNDWSDHAESSSAHGTSGGVVGVTNAQTLSNKTLVLPSIGAILNASATLFLPTDGTQIASADGSDVLFDKTIFNPSITSGSADFDNLFLGGVGVVTLSDSQTLTGKILSGAELTGSITNSGTITGGTVNPTILRQNGVDVVTVSGTQNLTNKTISGGTLSGTIAGSPTLSGAPNFTGVPTLNGSPLASRRYTMTPALLTTNSSTTSGSVDLITVADVDGGNTLSVIEFSAFAVGFSHPAGYRSAEVQIVLNGNVVGRAVLSNRADTSVTDERVGPVYVRSVVSVPDNSTIVARLVASTGIPTVQVIATSSAQGSLTARPVE